MIAAAFAAARATITAAAAITARTTVTTARAATITAITAIRPVTARFTRLAGRTGIFQFGTGFLIDHAHRQANLAARIDLENLDLHFLAFGQNVGHLLDPLVADF